MSAEKKNKKAPIKPIGSSTDALIIKGAHTPKEGISLQEAAATIRDESAKEAMALQKTTKATKSPGVAESPKETPKPILLNVKAEVELRNSYYAEGSRDSIEVVIGQLTEVIKKDSFNAGVRHVIEIAEGRLAKSLDLNDRQELSSHGGIIPSWWLATLFSRLWYEELKVSSEVR